MARTIRVCARDEIADGGCRIVTVGEIEIGVLRQGGEFYAYQNLCPHQGGPACEGVRMAGIRENIDGNGNYLGQLLDEDDMHIVCPWHGYEYHLKTGINVADDRLRLRRFEIVRQEGDIYVTLP